MPRRHGPKDWRPPRSDTPEKIFEILRRLAPSCVFDVEWDEDSRRSWNGDPAYNPRDHGFSPYNVEFSVSFILRGHLIKNQSYLGDVWDDPSNLDPDTGGYLPQKLEETIEGTFDRKLDLPGSLIDELEAAQKYLKEVLKVRYDLEQRRRGRE